MKNLTKSIIAVTVLSGTMFGYQSAEDSFKTADVNGDNIVTSEEFYNNQAKHMEQMAAEGRPMRNAGSAPTFEDIDANGDGMLEFEEYQNFHTQRQQEMREKRSNQGSGMGPGSGKGQGMGPGQGMNQGQGMGLGMGQGAGMFPDQNLSLEELKERIIMQLDNMQLHIDQSKECVLNAQTKEELRDCNPRNFRNKGKGYGQNR
eukprot:Anaeramoba_ignava/a612027_16.p2 GENE.a612027_16~~a612027_16.p2  ORF type:complete len:203 (-),score=-9.26 a612027_16:1136-1744(-)